ncbi:hypothetical protein AB0C31_52460, partial [Actinoplanes philippinensis]
MPAPGAPNSEDVEELMRRPPLYSQQNTPLDAPRFTRSARPPQPAAAPPMPGTFGTAPRPGAPDQAGALPPPAMPAPQSGASAPDTEPAETPQLKPMPLPPLQPTEMGQHNAEGGQQSARSPLQAPDM